LRAARARQAVAVGAGRRYKAYEMNFNGEIGKDASGRWTHMAEYKMTMLPLLGLLYRRDVRAGKVTPVPRGTEDDACSESAALGAASTPRSKAALAKVAPISASSLRSALALQAANASR